MARQDDVDHVLAQDRQELLLEVRDGRGRTRWRTRRRGRSRGSSSASPARPEGGFRATGRRCPRRGAGAAPRGIRQSFRRPASPTRPSRRRSRPASSTGRPRRPVRWSAGGTCASPRSATVEMTCARGCPISMRIATEIGLARGVLVDLVAVLQARAQLDDDLGLRPDGDWTISGNPVSVASRSHSPSSVIIWSRPVRRS